jgi:NADH-quinone oxidoreductase subunit A
MLSDYGYVGLFLLFGIAFVASALAVSWLFRPRAANVEKNYPYECGEIVKGSTWIQFNVHYYLIALIFVIFDVEVLFLVPWAVVLTELGFVAYAGMLVFIAILILGLVYAWKKGVLNWQ